MVCGSKNPTTDIYIRLFDGYVGWELTFPNILILHFAFTYPPWRFLTTYSQALITSLRHFIPFHAHLHRSGASLKRKSSYRQSLRKSDTPLVRSARKAAIRARAKIAVLYSSSKFDRKAQQTNVLFVITVATLNLDVFWRLLAAEFLVLWAIDF